MDNNKIPANEGLRKLIERNKKIKANGGIKPKKINLPVEEELNWGEMLCELIKNPKLTATSVQYFDVVGWKDGTLVELTSLRDRKPAILKNETWVINKPE